MNEITRFAADQADDFRARFTTAEFEQMCDSGAFGDWKIELIDGELERMQSPMNLHAMRQAKVVILLAQVFEMERVRGAVGIDLGNNTMVECDAAILREPVTTNRRLLPADLMLVVEVAETTVKRDLGMKRLKYAAAGISEYWVLDSSRLATHVFRESNRKDYIEVDLIPFDQPLAVPGTDATITLD